MTSPRVETAGAVREYVFPAGLPAFEQERRFRLVARPEFSPLVLLESTARPDLRFVCAPAAVLEAGYVPETSEDDEALLECGPGDAAAGRLLCLAILTFAEAGPPTANLMAPVLLNPAAGRGVQSIQSTADYSCCHPVRGGPACS